MKENPIDTLSQLDRIEYLQKENNNFTYYISFLFYIGFCFLLTLLDSLFSIIALGFSLWWLIKYFKSSRNLDKEYFKVVKK